MDWSKLGKFLVDNQDDIRKIAEDSAKVAKCAKNIQEERKKRKEERKKCDEELERQIGEIFDNPNKIGVIHIREIYQHK